MKPEEIKIYDWVRIIGGQVPAVFYLELMIRVIIVYILLMVSMRLLGKRMATKISRVELVAMVSLASAIGVPMLSPDRGIIPAFIIATIVVIISRWIAKRSFKDQYFERITHGNLDLLVEDGIIHNDNMKRTRITKERLLAHLRCENLNHLGKVKRLYMESNGSFSLVKNPKPNPGLMIIPEWDTDFIAKKVKATDITVCRTCGTPPPENADSTEGKMAKCPNCGENEWTKAVTDI